MRDGVCVHRHRDARNRNPPRKGLLAIPTALKVPRTGGFLAGFQAGRARISSCSSGLRVRASTRASRLATQALSARRVVAPACRGQRVRRARWSLRGPDGLHHLDPRVTRLRTSDCTVPQLETARAFIRAGSEPLLAPSVAASSFRLVHPVDSARQVGRAKQASRSPTVCAATRADDLQEDSALCCPVATCAEAS